MYQDITREEYINLKEITKFNMNDCQINIFKNIISNNNCKIGDSDINIFEASITFDRKLLAIYFEEIHLDIEIIAIGDNRFIMFTDLYVLLRYKRNFFILDDPYQILDVIDYLNITYF